VIEAIGRNVIFSWEWLKDFLLLWVNAFANAITPPFRKKDILAQLYFVANQSLPIVALCVSFAAIVTIIEASFHMKLVVKDDSLVPGFAALLILRELGAVLAALLVTSRVGAGLAAEVGSMKITEQIDALKALGIDPVRFLVVPRLIASILGVMVLTIFSNFVCILGAMLVSIFSLGFTAGAFLSAMNQFVEFKDLLFAMIKGACFGAVIPIVSCHYGFRCEAGAEGVGRATTNSVVASSILIIILDFILAWIFSHFY